jgi:hypothetical protein
VDNDGDGGVDDDDDDDLIAAHRNDDRWQCADCREAWPGVTFGAGCEPFISENRTSYGPS